MEIIENFLAQQNLDQLKNSIFSEKFPWYYVDYVAKPVDDKNFYFIHEAMRDQRQCSDWLPIFHPIMGRLNYSIFIRIRTNLYTKKEEQVADGFHVDIPGDPNNMSGILYLNTNNGYTLFKNNKKVESVENRLILFKGSEEHCSVAQTDTKFRVVVNINFYP